MWTQVLAFVVLTSILSKQVHSCSCMPEHEQATFCWADAVFKAKVTSEEAIRENSGPFIESRTYGLELLGVYRDVSGALKEGDDIRVRTAGDGGRCGISLTRGKEYYLSAYKYRGEFNVGLCGMHTSVLTQHQEEGIVNGKFDCKCKVKQRFSRFPEDKQHLICAFAIMRGGYDYDCLRDHAFCRFDEQSQRCSWEADESQEICKRLSLPPNPIRRQ
uniref:Uncharacterized protein n=1 Tax=Pinctada fucata TaxID=50426 RepID=A0A194AQ98_PINFU